MDLYIFTSWYRYIFMYFYISLYLRIFLPSFLLPFLILRPSFLPFFLFLVKHTMTTSKKYVLLPSFNSFLHRPLFYILHHPLFDFLLPSFQFLPSAPFFLHSSFLPTSILPSTPSFNILSFLQQRPSFTILSSIPSFGVLHFFTFFLRPFFNSFLPFLFTFFSANFRPSFNSFLHHPLFNFLP